MTLRDGKTSVRRDFLKALQAFAQIREICSGKDVDQLSDEEVEDLTAQVFARESELTELGEKVDPDLIEHRH